MKVNVKIDNEFKALMPELSKEEHQQLESNLLDYGCRDPLVLWGNILIDGYNRHGICTKYNLTYATTTVDLKSRKDALTWIITNQLGRRNLNLYQRSVLALKLKDEVSARAKQNQRRGGKGSQKSAEAKNAGIDTRQELAKIAEVSHDTISKVEVIEREATDELKAKLSAGDISLNKAYASLKGKKPSPKKKPPVRADDDNPNKELSAVLKDTLCKLRKLKGIFENGKPKISPENKKMIKTLAATPSSFPSLTACEPAIKPKEGVDVQIARDLLLKAVMEAGAPALSQTAQRDMSNLAPLIQSIDLNIGKDLVVRSACDVINARVTVSALKPSSAVVTKPVHVLVPAKALRDWLKVQPEDAVIEIIYSKRATPRILNDADPDQFALYLVGEVRFTARASTGVCSDLCMESYNPEQVRAAGYDMATASKLVDIRASEFEKAVRNVAFAACDSRIDKVMDKICVQVLDGELIFLTTNAVVACSQRVVSDAVTIHSDTSFLIPVEVADVIRRSSSPDEILKFSYDKRNSRIYVSSPDYERGWRCYGAEPGGKAVSEFPNVRMLLEKEYKHLAVFDKIDIRKTLTELVKLNKEARFLFEEGRGEVQVEVVHYPDDYTPETKYFTIPCSKPDTAVSMLLHVKHLLQAVRVIKSKKIQILLPENERSIKVSGSEDDSYSCFTMRRDAPTKEAG